MGLCAGLIWLFLRTKTGTAMTAVGSNPDYARASGISVDRMRTISVIISTLLGAIGIVVYQQSFGFIQLYNAPLFMPLSAVAAILIGGASINKASMLNVVVGAFLFQGLLTMTPSVINSALQTDMSEIIRIIVSNGMILYALTRKTEGGLMSNSSGKSSSLGRFFTEYAVVIIFLVITLASIKPSGLSLVYIVQEIITRLGRNSFLVLALLLPIYAGMGLNFGMTLGAMAGQIGLIFAINWNITGVQGLAFAALLGMPVSLLLGWVCGAVLNRAKGREMVTGYILAFFINGIYQFVVLYLMGSVIPITLPGHPAVARLRHPQHPEPGRGAPVPGQPADAAAWAPSPCRSPPSWSSPCCACSSSGSAGRKLGQDMRAVGYDMAVADMAGIAVDQTRIIAIIISTVLACFGQIIFLQNMGNVATYNAHDQTSFFAVAAILVGGASVKKATIPNVFIGVVLLHSLFVVSPLAGQNLFGSAMIGEYFRQFIGYGVIALSLVLYAWRSRREAERAREGLRGAAVQAAAAGTAAKAGAP